MATCKIELHSKTIAYQYENGISVKTIAKLHNVSEDTIYSRLKNMNYKMVNPFIRLVNKEKLYELYFTKNMSIDSIAKKYRVSYKTVRKGLKKYKLAIKGSIEKGN